MYTVVLMAAMTGAPELPDFGRRCHCACSGWCGGCCSGYCGGCCGGWCGGSTGCCGGVYYEGKPGEKVPPPKPGEKVPPPKPGEKVPPPKKTEAATPATIIVNLPADARLTVDGQPTQSTSSRRVLTSPPLEPGQEFYYTLRAEIMRDGQPVNASQRVAVRAGSQTVVTMQLPAGIAVQR